MYTPYPFSRDQMAFLRAARAEKRGGIAKGVGAKGICAICRKEVKRPQRRLKKLGGYIHEKCFKPVLFDGGEAAAAGKLPLSPAIPRGYECRGICRVCLLGVNTSHSRVQDVTGYLHNECYLHERQKAGNA